MAWLYQYKTARTWFIGWREGDKTRGKTTGTADRKEAEKQLAAFEALAGVAKAGGPVDELYRTLTGHKGDGCRTLKAELADWLQEADGTTSPGTVARYRVIADGFAKSLRADDQKPLLRDVTPDAIRRHLGETLKRKSASTTNMERRVLRVFFRRAVANGRLATDPCAAVKGLRGDPDARRRRPFTVDEVKTLLGKASGFWRYAILAGFYSGLRISDIAEMPVGAVDFKEGMIRVKTRKTGTRVAVPIPPALAALFKARIAELGKPGPDALLWPDYATKTSGQRSGEFHKLLVAAGLADTRTHRSTGKGRDAAREGSTISFHSLRHSFVSLLKATGSGQTIAKALAGHASDDISDHYTTIPTDVLRNAVAALPDVT